jgi:hypothetical protein
MLTALTTYTRERRPLYVRDPPSKKGHIRGGEGLPEAQGRRPARHEQSAPILLRSLAGYPEQHCIGH